MRALVKQAAGPGLSLMDVERPLVGTSDASVRVTNASLCGTDLQMYDWTHFAQGSAKKLPLIAGHEFTGEVIRVGDAAKSFTGTPIQVGDLVSGESHVYCGKCIQCTRGAQHVCQNTHILGVTMDGCFSEEVVVPGSSIWIHGKRSTPSSTIRSLYEPFGNAVHAVLTVEISHKSVAVFGAGPLGLFAVLLAKHLGADPVIAVDVSEYRLQLAKKIGADYSINAELLDAPSVVAKINDLTRHQGIDIVFEMSGSDGGVGTAAKACASGGDIVAMGLPDNIAKIDVANDIVLRGISIHGIIGRKIPKTWMETDKLVRKLQSKIQDLVTHELQIDEFEEAYDLMRSGLCGKIVFHLDRI